MNFRTKRMWHILMRMRFLLSVAAVSAMALGCGIVYAQSTSTSSAANDLQSQIDQNTQQITRLNSEIAQYQRQLDAAQKKGQTLKNTISQLNLSIKKTNTSIQITNKQINTTQLQIQQLSNNITSDEQTIAVEQNGLAESLRILNRADRQPLSVELLASNGIAQAWQDINDVETIQNSVDDNISKLAADKQVLSDHKTAQVTKNSQLQQQQLQLTVQKGSLAATRETQSQLLSQTRSQEATYQTIIAQKQAEEAQFEQALTNLKAQYNQAINPSQIPPFSPGTLSWPIAGRIRITQYFGNTPFANAHQPLYSGHGHDGVDIAAPIGTPVTAALDGMVLATGNTDATLGCQGGSFGKWVMLEHNDGLNTMYAHLSRVNVAPGQHVSTGDVIGYSGETGYATGPHLHFGVYVSSVTQIIPLGQATHGTSPCSRATMPVPPVSGYLNPLNYLPAVGV